MANLHVLSETAKKRPQVEEGGTQGPGRRGGLKLTTTLAPRRSLWRATLTCVWLGNLDSPLSEHGDLGGGEEPGEGGEEGGGDKGKVCNLPQPLPLAGASGAPP